VLKAGDMTFQRVPIASVKKAFDDAISSCARTGFSQIEAIANAAGDTFWANSCGRGSWQLYNEWVAIFKVNKLEEKYHFLQDSVDACSCPAFRFTSSCATMMTFTRTLPWMSLMNG
jgi:hypothetical protein